MPEGNEKYIAEMRDRSDSGMTTLLSDVEMLHYTDFPDHVNVGDSAIFLGAWRYIASRKLPVGRIDSIGTIDYRSVGSHGTPLINGGGNFGGLYPSHNDHRYALAAALAPEVPLLQAPQSVVFPTVEDERRFVEHLGARTGFIMAVRDTVSAARLHSLGYEGILAPDNVHLLGRIDAPSPTRSVTVLARTDGERAVPVQRGTPTVDWMNESLTAKVARHVREDAPRLSAVQRLVRPTVRAWVQKARARLDYGTRLLAPGETVVTDRLHAMLIGLQMGRRIVAIDNANGKLSAYANTWFEGLSVPVEFAQDFPAALRVATRTTI